MGLIKCPKPDCMLTVRDLDVHNEKHHPAGRRMYPPASKEQVDAFVNDLITLEHSREIQVFDVLVARERNKLSAARARSTLLWMTKNNVFHELRPDRCITCTPKTG